MSLVQPGDRNSGSDLSNLLHLPMPQEQWPMAILKGGKFESCRTLKKRTFSQTEVPQADFPYTILQQEGSFRNLLLPSHHQQTSSNAKMNTPKRCRLLELPAELRELIWMHTVTEWTPPIEVIELLPGRMLPIIQQKPIRMDRLNRPLPPAITKASQQVRSETLHLYYHLNIFQCWRPLYWLKDWSQSTFIDWLNSMGPERTSWLRHVVLLYKNIGELEYDVEEALANEGYQLQKGAITNQQELTEYEMCFEELGLPRHFGKQRRWDRWMAGSSS